jgi:hypothetical protein
MSDHPPITLPALATTRYSSWRPEHGVAVRTTVKHPRFWRGPKLEVARDLAPHGIFGTDMDEHEARGAYLERLDEREDDIMAMLAALGERHHGQTLVLLCFEDVHKGEACHRRWAAEWFEGRGIECPELPAPAKQ